MSPTNADRYPLRILKQSLQELKEESNRLTEVKSSYEEQLAECVADLGAVDANIADIRASIVREKG